MLGVGALGSGTSQPEFSACALKKYFFIFFNAQAVLWFELDTIPSALGVRRGTGCTKEPPTDRIKIKYFLFYQSAGTIGWLPMPYHLIDRIMRKNACTLMVFVL